MIDHHLRGESHSAESVYDDTGQARHFGDIRIDMNRIEITRSGGVARSLIEIDRLLNGDQLRAANRGVVRSHSRGRTGRAPSANEDGEDATVDDFTAGVARFEFERH